MHKVEFEMRDVAGREDDPQSKSRRRLLQSLIAGMSVLIGGTLASILASVFVRPAFLKRKQEWIELGPVAALNQLPRPFRFTVVERQGWMLQEREKLVYAFLSRDGRVEVLSSTCTHLGCTVRWVPEQGDFQCPCHGGVYDARGQVIDGPPPRPLPHLKADVRQGKIFIQQT